VGKHQTSKAINENVSHLLLDLALENRLLITQLLQPPIDVQNHNYSIIYFFQFHE
jgi:hypothetical protein